MPVIFDRVLPLNLIANTAIFYIAARLYCALFRAFGRNRFSCPFFCCNPAGRGDLGHVRRNPAFARLLTNRYGHSTFSERSICSRRSPPRPFIMRRLQWDRPTGFPLAGFHCYW